MAPRSRSYQLSASPVTVLAHMLFIAVTILVLVWLLYKREGLAFKSDNKFKIFNLHPFFMIIGFILIGGEAIMAYKTVPATRTTQRSVHLLLHLVALISGALGIYAVFKFQNERRRFPDQDLYTLHSWLGIGTISLYGLQWLLAFFSYVFPGAEMGTRASYLPWHTFFGLVIFFLAICTAEMGLLHKFLQLSLVSNQEALIVNFTGLLIVLFGISVGLTVFLPRVY